MFNDVTKIKELFSRLHLKLLSISFQNLFFQNFTCQTQGAAYTESVSELIHWFLWCSNLCFIHFKYPNVGKMKRHSYINKVYLTGLVTFNNQENLGIHSKSNVLVHVHERLS